MTKKERISAAIEKEIAKKESFSIGTLLAKDFCQLLRGLFRLLYPVAQFCAATPSPHPGRPCFMATFESSRGRCSWPPLAYNLRGPFQKYFHHSTPGPTFCRRRQNIPSGASLMSTGRQLHPGAAPALPALPLWP